MSRLLKHLFVDLPFLLLMLAALVVVAWAIFYFGIYLGLGNLQVRGHQEFAENGVAQIESARQMEQMYPNCRHTIVYTGRDSVSTWNAVAHFGGRYQLAMQVPVEIESSARGRMIGEPRFYLHEVREVSISSTGQVGASFSRSIDFGQAEWNAVVAAGGDYSVIGFDVIKNAPVPDFDRYAAP
jgi:hypothetical protein